MTKICIDDAFLKIDHNGIIIHREGGFLLISDSNREKVFSQVKSVINQGITPENSFITENDKQKENYIQDIIKAENLPDPALVIFSHLIPNNVQVVNQDQVTAIVGTSYPQKSAAGAFDEDFNLKNTKNASKEHQPDEKMSISITLLINEDLDYPTLLNLFIRALKSKISVLLDLDVKNSFNGNILVDSGEDSLLVACTGYDPSPNRTDEVKLRKSVQKCVKEAVNNSLKENGFPKTIIDFIRESGIEIDDLVQAGMELLVGVEETPKLRRKLQDQILKSLRDINVISLVLAGIRLEEDYARHRIAGVNVDDDPSYLYADEVLGMAIANQIAGTKALFNFKRYDEEKPGIIGELGPILDDVFAGVVAGSMSKIFEE